MTFWTFFSDDLFRGGVLLLLRAVSCLSEASRGASARAMFVGGRGRVGDGPGSRGGDDGGGTGCCGAGCCPGAGGGELLELDDEEDEDEDDRLLAGGAGVVSASGSTPEVLLVGG